MKTLTARQQEVLDYIKEFWRTRGEPPKITDVARKFAMYPNAAHCHVVALRRAGELEEEGPLYPVGYRKRIRKTLSRA